MPSTKNDFLISKWVFFSQHRKLLSESIRCPNSYLILLPRGSGKKEQKESVKANEAQETHFEILKTVKWLYN